MTDNSDGVELETALPTVGYGYREGEGKVREVRDNKTVLQHILHEDEHGDIEALTWWSDAEEAAYRKFQEGVSYGRQSERRALKERIDERIEERKEQEERRPKPFSEYARAAKNELKRLRGELEEDTDG